MKMNEQIKGGLIVFGIATATIFFWNFVAKSTIPLLSTAGQKVTSG